MGAGGAKEFSKSAEKVVDNDEVVTFDEGQLQHKESPVHKAVSTRISDDSKLFEPPPRVEPTPQASTPKLSKKISDFTVLDVDDKSYSCKDSSLPVPSLDDTPSMVAVDISEEGGSSYEDVLQDISPEKQEKVPHVNPLKQKSEVSSLSIKVPDATPAPTVTTPTNKKKKKKSLKSVKSNNSMRSVNSSSSDVGAIPVAPAAAPVAPQAVPQVAPPSSDSSPPIYYPPADLKSPVPYKRPPQQPRQYWSDIDDTSDSLRESQQDLMSKIAAENNKLLELQRQRTISTMQNAKLEMEVDALMKQLELLDRLDQEDEIEMLQSHQQAVKSHHPSPAAARKFPAPSPTAAHKQPISPRNRRNPGAFEASATAGAPLKKKTSFRYEGSKPTSHETHSTPPVQSHMKSPREANLVSMSPIQVPRHARPNSPPLPDFEISPSVNNILTSATVTASPTARYAEAKHPTHTNAAARAGRYSAAQVVDGFKEYKHHHHQPQDDLSHDLKKDRSRNVLKNLNRRHRHSHADESDIFETSTSSMYSSPSAALLSAVAPPKASQDMQLSEMKVAMANDTKSELKHVRGRRNRNASSSSDINEKPPRQQLRRKPSEESRSNGRVSKQTAVSSSDKADWSSTMDIKCSEVELLLRKPINNDDDIEFVLASAEAGLLFMDELNSVAKRLNLLRGTLTRWLLPYDNNTRIDEQSSSINSVVNSMPDALYGKLTEKQVNYLVTGANSVRQLIRIKIADDNDLEQAKEALKTSVDFFRRLLSEADKKNISPYQLMTSR